MRQGLSDTVHYLYWSDRRIQQIIDDGNVPGKSLGISGLGVSTPIASVQLSRSDQKPSKDAVARSIEKALKIPDMSTLHRADRATFTLGKGTAVFGEFVNMNSERLGIGSVFTSAQSADGVQTAICLFGSMNNFSDYMPTARVIPSGERANLFENGWASSAAPYIKEFIENDFRAGAEMNSRELASAALTILLKQGTHQAGKCPFTGFQDLAFS